MMTRPRGSRLLGSHLPMDIAEWGLVGGGSVWTCTRVIREEATVSSLLGAVWGWMPRRPRA